MPESNERHRNIDNSTIGGFPDPAVGEFWIWFRNSLDEGWMRGVVGEYWVAKALGLIDEPREAWKKWDLETPNGIKVEVKASGYLHRSSGKIRRVSRPRFQVPNVHVKQQPEKGLPAGFYRPADVYVFCLNTQGVEEDLEQLEVSQWEFYVLATQVLNDYVNPELKNPSIDLTFLHEHACNPVSFEDLGKTIMRFGPA